MKSLFWLFLALVCAAPVGFATAAEINSFAPVSNFYEVSPGIYRGARPDAQGLAALAELGVKTDLILDNDEEVNAREQREAERLGMRVFLKPLSGFNAPADEDTKEILTILADRRNYPIFIHCHYGRDRTGVMVGLHRVFTEKWDPRRAYDEMLKKGFHRSLVLLKRYFKKKTGLDSLVDD